MDAEQRAELLRRWENYARDRPGLATLFGPPSWLVHEEWKGRDDKGKDREPFADAAIRVRTRYGLPGSPHG